MSTQGRGVVRVDMGFLGDVLHLPDGCRIVRAREAEGFCGIIELLVEGPELPPIDPGQITPRVNLIVTVTETEEFVRRRTFKGKFA